MVELRDLTMQWGPRPVLDRVSLTMKPGDTEPGRIWEKAEILGEGFRWMQRSEITGGFVDATLDFIKRAEADGKPFYVNVWPDDVHGPFWPPVEHWGSRHLPDSQV